MMPMRMSGMGSPSGFRGQASPRLRLNPGGPPTMSRLNPLSSPQAFKKGGKVRKGGVAKLHKGEKKVTKRQYDSAKAALSGKTKTRKTLEAVGHELKVSPPKILAKTRAKSGAKQANKQRVAILLSKSRKAGANV